MNETYVDMVLNVPTDDAVREMVSFQLYELGFSGFLEDDGGIHCYIHRQQWNDALQKKLQSLWDTHQPHSIAISNITEIQNQNWNRQWEESIQPIDVAEKIIIAPSWHSVSSKDKIVLVIDPKMSFGTGLPAEHLFGKQATTNRRDLCFD